MKCSKKSLTKQPAMGHVLSRSTYLENLSSIQESLRLLTILKQQTKDTQYCLQQMEQYLTNLRENFQDLKLIESSGHTGRITLAKNLSSFSEIEVLSDCSLRKLPKKSSRGGQSFQE